MDNVGQLYMLFAHKFETDLEIGGGTGYSGSTVCTSGYYCTSQNACKDVPGSFYIHLSHQFHRLLSVCSWNGHDQRNIHVKDVLLYYNFYHFYLY
jgi:hypothetical protein